MFLPLEKPLETSEYPATANKPAAAYFIQALSVSLGLASSFSPPFHLIFVPLVFARMFLIMTFQKRVPPDVGFPNFRRRFWNRFKF